MEARTLLVFDGVFSQRLELRSYWDLTVFMEAESRGLSLLYSNLPEAPPEREAELERRRAGSRRQRYVDGQALYSTEAKPRAHADLIIDNNDLGAPAIL